MFYIPPYMGKNADDVASFLNNYVLRLPQFAAALGFDAALVQYVKDGAALYNWYQMVHLPELREASKNATDSRDMFAADKDPTDFSPTDEIFTPRPTTATPIKDGFVPFIDNQVKSIRLMQAYKIDPTIGSALGITETVSDTSALVKAAIAGVEALAGFAMQVKAYRYGAKTVLYYDMADATAPKLLAALASATFSDDRPPTVLGQSEMRSYAVRYGDNQGKPLPGSLMSDVVSAPTHP